MGEQARDLAVERIGIGEVHQPDGAPADLVLVGRADAAPRRADAVRASVALLAMRVEIAIERQNQRNVLGDLEVVRG